MMTKKKMSRVRLYRTNLIKCLSIRISRPWKIVIVETLSYKRRSKVVVKAEEKFLLHLYTFCMFCVCSFI